MSTARALLALLEPHLDASGRTWLSRASALAGPRADPTALLEALASAGHRLGHRPLPADALADGPLPPLPDGWPLEQVGRIALLLRAEQALDAPALEALLGTCFRQGDIRERQAVLRALPLLGAPERLLPLALEACRTHVQPVFEAIACENRYPAAHFPEASFNHLVLKAVFIGVPLARVVGLEGRRTAELARMAADFAREREAAGRPVPADLSLLLPTARATA